MVDEVENNEHAEYSLAIVQLDLHVKLISALVEVIQHIVTDKAHGYWDVELVIVNFIVLLDFFDDPKSIK